MPIADEHYHKSESPDAKTLTTDREKILHGKKILLVDDNFDNALPLKMFLKLEGADVLTASSGAEALEILGKTDFDVLISDIGMPKMDGFGLIAEVRKNAAGRNSRVPSIAVTAYASSEDKKQTRSAGFQSHVSKPIDFDEAIKAIADVLKDEN
jgi:CheY-like chemotaxis protein